MTEPVPGLVSDPVPGLVSDPGPGPVTESGPAAWGVGFLLGAAHRERRRAWEAELADLALTAPQAAVLRLVVSHPGGGVRSLARELHTDPMNAQRIVEALNAAGLCEALRDPRDARRRPLYPTAEGRRLAELVAERARHSERQLAELLGPDYHHLLATLRRIAAPGG